MVLKVPWAQKQLLRAFEKGIFQFFASFWVTKLKPSSCHRKCLKEWFWSFLQLKKEYSQRLKRSFFNFLQIFKWRSWNGFLGVGHRKLLRKWFSRYLELKNEYSECFKRSVFSIFQIFEWQSWNNFLGKWASVWKDPFSVFSKVLVNEAKTNFWEIDAKRQKLFKSKLAQSKFLRK